MGEQAERTCASHPGLESMMLFPDAVQYIQLCDGGKGQAGHTHIENIVQPETNPHQHRSGHEGKNHPSCQSGIN